MKKINWERVVDLAARIYVFIFLNVYGWAKLFGGQFYTPDKTPEIVLETTIQDVSDFDLAWTFMGRSLGYMVFLGISEILGAWLLLFNRTKLLGALILLIILVNVIAFDIFFLDKYGALASAVIYMLLLLVVLWINRMSIRTALSALMGGTAWRIEQASLLTFVLAALLMAVIFGLDQFVVNLLGHGKG